MVAPRPLRPPGAGGRPDPGWPDLDGLPGVADAVERARSAIAAVRRLPANRRGWARTAAAAGIRAARASAMLDGGSAVLDAGVAGLDAGVAGLDAEVAGAALSDVAVSPGRVTDAAPAMPGGGPAPHSDAVVTDPVLAGALRVSAAIGELATVWRRAPLQALARLHTLAAADLAPADELGRPRPAPELSPRLAALADVVTASPWSGPVTVAVVHGELLALRPFGSADGVVARGAARLTMVTTGLDPQALTVPEVGHLRAGTAYPRAAAGFADGRTDGLPCWIEHVCAALVSGAREAGSIAAAAGG